MAEGKEYISHESELGSVSISEEVLTIIAAAAAVDVEGVSSLGSGLSSEGTATANRKALTKGVRLEVEDERVTVDLSILVRYGYVVTDVAKAGGGPGQRHRGGRDLPEVTGRIDGAGACAPALFPAFLLFFMEKGFLFFRRSCIIKRICKMGCCAQ